MCRVSSCLPHRFSYIHQTLSWQSCYFMPIPICLAGSGSGRPNSGPDWAVSLHLMRCNFFWYFDEIFSISFQYFRNLPDWALAVHQVHCQHLAFFQDAADVSEPSWWWWCSGWEVGLIRVTFIWMLMMVLMIRPYISKILIPGFSKLF